MSTLLHAARLRKTFRRGTGQTVHAVNDVSLEIARGETLGLIGESGSGKSTIGRLVLGLIEADDGEISFDGRDVRGVDRRQRRALTAEMTIVFQEPYESLNPRMTVGAIVSEPLAIHARDLSRAERRARVLETLGLVALDASFADRYPRQLSGGQQQRVGIARAIVTRPKFVVLDEPTSALDLSVQSQVLGVLQDLQQRLGLSFLYISHDIHTVRYVSQRVAVLYLGQVVEIGPTASVLERPRHPYTQALLAAGLVPDPDVELPQLRLSGEIPTPTALPPGCFFASRCPYRNDPRCETERPPLRPVADGHEVACFYEAPTVEATLFSAAPTA